MYIHKRTHNTSRNFYTLHTTTRALTPHSHVCVHIPRDVYGKHSKGDSRKDVLSFSAYRKLAERVYGDRLVHFEDIRGTYNFDTFLKSSRPAKADADIKKHLAWDLEVRDVNGRDCVFVRTKKAMGAKTKWNEYIQCYPSLLDYLPPTPHPPTAVPPPAPLKDWDDLYAKIVPTLIK